MREREKQRVGVRENECVEVCLWERVRWKHNEYEREREEEGGEELE
mgnify:CR=1 FL=1